MLFLKTFRRLWPGTSGDVARSLISAVVALWLTHSFLVLDGTNIGWLGAGDSAAGYLGWAFYRSEPWGLNIFAVPSYGLELSSTVPYTGSIPLAALVFKTFSSVLPDIFQIVGIWILVAFFLQGLIAQRLLSIFVSGVGPRWLGSGFFVMAPPLIHRSVVSHEVLFSHFIILIALWVYLGRIAGPRFWVWPLTMSLAILLFPYYPFMLFPIWFADIFRRFRDELPKRRLAAEVACGAVCLAFLAWLLGLFGGGARGGGYGKFKMNLLALIDSDNWSWVLPDIPNAHPYEFEGFNFLGIGLIFLAVVAGVLAARNWSNVGSFLKRNFVFVFGLGALTIFSLSNAIGIGPLKLEIPVPLFVKEIGDVIRATGRFFWPVFYALALAILVLIFRLVNAKVANILVGLALIVQIVDTAPGWLFHRQEIQATSGREWETSLSDPLWHELASRHTKLRTLPASSHYLWREVGYLALEEGLDVDGVYLSRIGTEGKSESEAERERLFLTGVLDDGAFYIVEPSFWEERRSEISGLDAQIQVIDNVVVVFQN